MVKRTEKFLDGIEKFLKLKGLRSEVQHKKLDSKPSYPPSDAEKIAKECGQIAKIKDLKGNVSEPLWYHGLQVLRHTVDGDKICHDWSKGHPKYSAEETQTKLDHLNDQNVFATSCHKFDEKSFNICVNCPHWGNIKSPIELGYMEQMVDEVKVPSLPTKFRLLKGNRIGFIGQDEDGEPIMKSIIQSILFFEKIAFRSSGASSDTYLVGRYLKPTGGWTIVELSASHWSGTKSEVCGALGKFGVVVMPDDRQAVDLYVKEWARMLQTKQEAVINYYNSLGWQEDNSFILDKAYFPDGKTKKVEIQYKELQKDVVPFGDYQVWKRAVQQFLNTSPISHQFGFMAAFAAPLFRLTPHKGIVIGLYSPKSGVGKTFTQYLGASIYGNPDGQLIISGDSTHKGTLGKAQVLNSLPLIIDEQTVMNDERFAQLLLSISTGRDKTRGNKDGGYTETNYSWSTIGITSANKSIYQVLESLGSNAEAESMRAFEVHVQKPSDVTLNSYNHIGQVVSENYGYAGVEFIKYVTTHIQEVRVQIQEITQKLQPQFEPRERFWLAAVACIITACKICERLGIVSVDYRTMLKWVFKQIKNIRGETSNLVDDPVSLVSSFLAENIENQLVTSGNITSSSAMIKSAVVLRHPKRELVVMTDTQGDFMYVREKAFNEYVMRKSYAAKEVRKSLQDMGLLIESRNVNMTEGITEYPSTRHKCLIFDKRHSEFGKKLEGVIEQKADTTNKSFEGAQSK